MYTQNNDGTLTAGYLDTVLILHNIETDTYHVCTFYEAPMPGTGGISGDTVRLKSKSHHTQGSPTLEGAQVQLEELLGVVHYDEHNILREPAIDWDGQLGLVLVVPNWRQPGRECQFGLVHA